MVRTRLRQLLTGAVMEKSFRSSEKFEEPDIELAPASFLYSDTHGFHFMDEKSYEQFTFSAEAVDTDRGYLKEGVSLQVLNYNGVPVSLQFHRPMVLLVQVLLELFMFYEEPVPIRDSVPQPLLILP